MKQPRFLEKSSFLWKAGENQSEEELIKQGFDLFFKHCFHQCLYTAYTRKQRDLAHFKNEKSKHLHHQTASSFQRKLIEQIHSIQLYSSCIVIKLKQYGLQSKTWAGQQTCKFVFDTVQQWLFLLILYEEVL